MVNRGRGRDGARLELGHQSLGTRLLGDTDDTTSLPASPPVASGRRYTSGPNIANLSETHQPRAQARSMIGLHDCFDRTCSPLLLSPPGNFRRQPGQHMQSRNLVPSAVEYPGYSFLTSSHHILYCMVITGHYAMFEKVTPDRTALPCPSTALYCKFITTIHLSSTMDACPCAVLLQ